MVTGDMQKAVRAEYKEYLEKEHPDWSASSVATHCADAFYLANNDSAKPFWQYMESDASMQEAKEEIIDYLVTEAMSERAEQRGKGYFNDLCMLKQFLDNVYGGVKNRIGAEYDGEKILYYYAKMVYDGKMDIDSAVKKMHEEIPAYNIVSYRMLITSFHAMREGKKYTYRFSMGVIAYFIRQIGAEYGKECLIKALFSVRENIKYIYEQMGNKSNALMRECRKIAEENQIEIDFSDAIFAGIIPKKNTDNTLEDVGQIHYWLYAAGTKSEYWDQDLKDGVMAIGYKDLGDLTQYDSKEAIRISLQHQTGQSGSFRNDVHAVWQFVNEIKPSDIIFVKRGVSKIIGKGTVAGEYEFLEDRDGYRNVRTVQWEESGEWAYSGTLPQKTLTDITKYRDMVKELLTLFDAEAGDIPEKEEPAKDYTKEDFLDDVYMTEAQYDKLCKLLMLQKNVILQGAPGVGKTFAAKRLAYSIIGQQDKSRVKIVQFHQSYSYEDFIMGYRPCAEGGFELRKGVFYEFCKQAEMDDRPYFFIIDEINRGNLSKIFGELFMLIESDKRDMPVQLLYREEEFSIPSNVYLIGMMNTADRSLAMMDYALRRRFAFYDMGPAFRSEGFRAYQSRKNSPKLDNLICQVERLNREIAEDETLGEGFQIGHSYFCTDNNIDDDWLFSVVEFQLIPLLKEYWYDDPTKVENWGSSLRRAIQ